MLLSSRWTCCALRDDQRPHTVEYFETHITGEQSCGKAFRFLDRIIEDKLDDGWEVKLKGAGTISTELYRAVPVAAVAAGKASMTGEAEVASGFEEQILPAKRDSKVNCLLT
jgi:hypothetical protein